MNPVFWFLVLLVAFIVWVVSRPLWEPFGSWLLNRQDKINETLNKVNEENNGEKGDDLK